MAEKCVECLAEIPDSRVLRDAKIEEAFDARPSLLSCPACLTVQRASVILVRGSAVARAREALEAASAEGRLAAELMRVSRAPETWPLARIPEVFSACGFRTGAPVRTIADCAVFVERRRVRARDEGEAHEKRDWAVLQRRFNGKWTGAPGESSESSLSWENRDPVGAGAVMNILRLEPPAIVLEPQAAWVQTSSFMMGSIWKIDSFRVYADAVAPFDIQ